MSAHEKLSINLTPALRALVQGAVASGQYASATEVVHEALIDWSEQQNLRHYTVEELQKLWNDGIASGRSKALSMEDIIARANQRFATRGSEVT